MRQEATQAGKSKARMNFGPCGKARRGARTEKKSNKDTADYANKSSGPKTSSAHFLQVTCSKHSDLRHVTGNTNDCTPPVYIYSTINQWIRSSRNTQTIWKLLYVSGSEISRPLIGWCLLHATGPRLNRNEHRSIEDHRLSKYRRQLSIYPWRDYKQ